MNTMKAQCTMVEFQTIEEHVDCLNIYGEHVTRPELRTLVFPGKRVTAINEEGFAMVRGDTQRVYDVTFREFEPVDRFEDIDASLGSWLDDYSF